MADSKTISLLIPPVPSSATSNLQTQIQQVIAQKGHFYKVTEESLRSEIQGKAPSQNALVSFEQSEDSQADETPQKRQERLWKKREQMIEQLNYAQNEILCALDFVSLLISKQSIPARSSMSPALKDAVPIGTLSSHVVSTKPLPESTRRDLKLVSQGWRSEAFKSVSDKLASASVTLNAVAERESSYWAQIADLKSRGWPVSRLPRDNKAIGVHFGFPEAAPQFRDRGFAILRQSDDGSMYLDSHARPRRQQRLGVYIIRQGKTTGAFCLRPSKRGDASDINRQITEARDSLFEEELFYEISREARLIANQGALSRAQSVEVSIGDQYQICLKFAEQQENIPTLRPEDNELAEFLALSLGLLLTTAHEQSLARRSVRPPVMTLKPRPSPEYAILRPILVHLRHKVEVDALRTNCDKIVTVLSTGGLPTSTVTSRSDAAGLNNSKIESSASALSDLLLPARTTIKFKLARSLEFDVDVATFLGQPLFGTRFDTSTLEFGFATIRPSQQQTLEAATAFVRRVLLLGLVSHVEQIATQQTSSDDQGKNSRWRVSSPYNGELTLYNSGEIVQKVQIALQSHSFSLKWTPDARNNPRRHAIWTWTAKGCSHAKDAEIKFDPELKFEQVVMQIVGKHN